ncbi:MAG: hypothetical protein Q8O67_07350 [Deltaproteobacteria bacterium]|nr:hypothetical protein [Deltaproteobacteria bacterium]
MRFRVDARLPPVVAKTTTTTTTTTAVVPTAAVVNANVGSAPIADAATIARIKAQVLGLDEKARSGPAGVGASTILDVLGKGRFAEVPCVRVEGEVSWCNFELLRQMGIPVPPGNVMTPELQKLLVDNLAFRAVKPGEDTSGKTVQTLYADRYGGSGIGDNGGAGRAAFLPWGNLNIKGVGITPLAVVDPDDFQHSHGGAPMREGLVEAVWGEVGTNLFSQGSTRILAVIDVHDRTMWPDGGSEKRALIIRATDQLRPAHLLAGFDGGDFSKDAFLAMAKNQGLLVEQGGKQGAPDIAATMGGVIDRHASTSAEQWRWRVVHGAISTGNMQIGGRQLDLATMSAQPSTSFIKTLEHGGTYGKEHEERATELQLVYDAIQGTLSPAEQQALHAVDLDVAGLMDTAYARQLDLQVLDAMGLKPSMARALYDDASTNKAAAAFADTVLDLAALRNGAGALLAEKSVINDAVVDVFHLLGRLPAELAGGRSLDRALVKELLRPQLIGSERKKGETTRALDRLIDRFITTYPAVMAAATTKAADHYDSVEAMQRSIGKRAAFENRPLDQLYKSQLDASLVGAIDAYERTGDARLFKEVVDQASSASLRSVEGLLGAGRQKKIEGGAELNGRAIDGVEYGVKATTDGKRRLLVGLPVQQLQDGRVRLATMPGAPELTSDQATALRYRFSTDNWQTYKEITPTLHVDDDGLPQLRFEIPVLKSDVGMIEGLFHAAAGQDLWIKDGASNFRGYAFAVPDQRELGQLLGG